jgi:hypothetical protein
MTSEGIEMSGQSPGESFLAAVRMLWRSVGGRAFVSAVLTAALGVSLAAAPLAIRGIGVRDAGGRGRLTSKDGVSHMPHEG